MPIVFLIFLSSHNPDLPNGRSLDVWYYTPELWRNLLPSSVFPAGGDEIRCFHVTVQPQGWTVTTKSWHNIRGQVVHEMTNWIRCQVEGNCRFWWTVAWFGEMHGIYSKETRGDRLSVRKNWLSWWLWFQFNKHLIIRLYFTDLSHLSCFTWKYLWCEEVQIDCEDNRGYRNSLFISCEDNILEDCSLCTGDDGAWKFINRLYKRRRLLWHIQKNLSINVQSTGRLSPIPLLSRRQIRSACLRTRSFLSPAAETRPVPNVRRIIAIDHYSFPLLFRKEQDVPERD